MGRERLPARLHSLVRRHVHQLSASSPRHRYGTNVLAKQPVTDYGRVSNFFFSAAERRLGTFPSHPHSSSIMSVSGALKRDQTSVSRESIRRLIGPQDINIKSIQRVTACSHEQRRGHTSGQDFSGKEKISVTFVTKDGEESKIQVPVGMSMLEAAHENDIELEGACEGSLACSTCHVIVMEEEMYTRLPEPTDEENDMLDLAFGLTETSRLGCQVIAQPELDGLNLALPAATRNFAVDGHVPKPH